MTDKLGREDVVLLRENFALAEYEVREGLTAKSGKVRWFVYVRREAIINRLDDVVPFEWSDALTDQHVADKFASITCSITIRGITRQLNGSCSGNSEENNIKGAATDAFKRAASMWGIGLNLQSAPMIWTDGGYHKEDKKGKKYVADYKMRDAQEKQAITQFGKWLSGGKKTPKQSPPSKRKARENTILADDYAPPPNWILDDESYEKFCSWCLEKFGIEDGEIPIALNADSRSDYHHSKDMAQAQIIAYAADYNPATARELLGNVYNRDGDTVARIGGIVDDIIATVPTRTNGNTQATPTQAIVDGAKYVSGKGDSEFTRFLYGDKDLGLILGTRDLLKAISPAMRKNVGSWKTGQTYRFSAPLIVTHINGKISSITEDVQL